MPVARKVIRDSTIKNEEFAARVLRESITNHNRILGVHAIYRCGESLNIIYPLAETNLQDFIEDEKYDMHWSRPGSFGNVTAEICHLASGLSFLHEGVEDPETGHHFNCHMDFRPKNILVFLIGDTNSFSFKISDFGITKFKPQAIHRQRTFDRQNLITGQPLQQDTKTYARRGSGTYQPPEMRKSMKVGRKSDVWSLACIIIQLLIRALLGREKLDKFDDDRSESGGGDDFFYTKGPREKWVLNPAVDSWLQDLTQPVGNFAKALLSRCKSQDEIVKVHVILKFLSGTIRQALAIDEAARCEAKSFHDELSEVRAQFEGLLREGYDVTAEFKSLHNHGTPSYSSTTQVSGAGEGLQSSAKTDLPYQPKESARQICQAYLPRIGISRVRVPAKVETYINRWLGQPDSAVLCLYGETEKKVTQCLYHMASDSGQCVLAIISDHKVQDEKALPFHTLKRLIDQLVEIMGPSSDLPALIGKIMADEDIDGAFEILNTLMMRQRGCVIFIDDMRRLIATESDINHDFWTRLFDMLGCSGSHGIRRVDRPTCKTFVRSSGPRGHIGNLLIKGDIIKEPSNSGTYLVNARFKSKFVELFVT